ncbi:MAG TPA: hypothetical protein VG455_09050, partial [Acidimicrobiales bacterium]|nr:hypothetical protein [Acidimicrobiales bacterium]
PDHVESIADHLETKLAALLCHRSQYRSTMRVDDPGAADQLESFRARIAGRAAEHGQPVGVAYGEAFKAIREL